MRIKLIALFTFVILPLAISAAKYSSINLSKVEDDRLAATRGLLTLCGHRIDSSGLAFIICLLVAIIVLAIIIIVKLK